MYNFGGFSQLQELLKTFKPSFLFFEDIHFKFHTVAHTNELNRWGDFRKDQTSLRPFSELWVFKTPSRNLSRPNSRTDRVKLLITGEQINCNTDSPAQIITLPSTTPDTAQVRFVTGGGWIAQSDLMVKEGSSAMVSPLRRIKSMENKELDS